MTEKRPDMAHKVIIFEELSVYNLPLYAFYALLGRKIFYVSMTSKHRGLVERIRRYFSIEKLCSQELSYETEVLCHRLALEHLDDIYERLFAPDRLIKGFCRQLKDGRIHSAYRKIVLGKIHAFFRTRQALCLGAKRFHPGPILFVSHEYAMVQKWFSFLDDEPPMTTAKLGAVYEAFIRLCRHLRWWGGFIVFPFWVLHKIRKVDQGQPVKNFQVGIRIYRTDLGFHQPYRAIDFLLDDKTITKDNAVFCIETPIAEEYRRKLHEKQYNVFDLMQSLTVVTKGFFRKVVLREFLFNYPLSIARALFSPYFITRLTLRHWMIYLNWKNFLETRHINHLVTYNDFGPEHIIRNIVLNQAGIKTWFYMHSRHIDDLFAPLTEKDALCYSPFSHLHFDYFVRWSRNIEDFFKPHAIGQFLDMGCLWSEHIRLITEREDFPSIKKSYEEKCKALPGKLIVVYDTTFGYGDGIVLYPKDAINFLDGLLKLLGDFPEVGFLFKGKRSRKDMEAYPEVFESYDRLLTHPRCFCKKDGMDPAEANAVGDLSISACYTSMTLEALGARKKGIYYQADDRFKGTYYDQIPKLVAHGYDQLKDLVKYWLYEATDKDFDQWMEQYIVGEIDAYADGKGITRMRGLLAKKSHEKPNAVEPQPALMAK